MTNRIVKKTDKQWLEVLSPAVFQVTRRGATEKPFSGEFWDNKRPGFFKCICCQTLLFSAKDQYNPDTGWASFKAPMYDDRIKLIQIDSGGDRRVQVKCAACDANLGAFFDDGPPPTRKRYSINSLALAFQPDRTAK